ncbi:MAG: class I SAM-dependent methyltransferase [Gemmobacter sp.]
MPYRKHALICPDCRAALDGAVSCAACGLAFDEVGGRLAVLARRPRSVLVDYDPAAATDPPRRVMRFPSPAGQPADGVHHLDRAHAEVLRSLPEGSRMLEVGCGGGQMRSWASARGLDYTGTDISLTRVPETLRRHGGPDFLCDAHALPFTDAVFDAVYSVAVWEHLGAPQLAAAEAQRVLKPGGWMVGSMSFLEPWHDASLFHMTPGGVFRTLSGAGLEPLAVWPEFAWPGFRAMLSMGNKATRPLAVFGMALYGWYLAPKVAQFVLRNRRLPARDDLYDPVARVAGAIAWIARKPATALPERGS